MTAAGMIPRRSSEDRSTHGGASVRSYRMPALLGVLAVLFGTATYVCLERAVANDLAAAFRPSFFFPSKAENAEARAARQRAHVWGAASFVAAAATAILFISGIVSLYRAVRRPKESASNTRVQRTRPLSERPP